MPVLTMLQCTSAALACLSVGWWLTVGKRSLVYMASMLIAAPACSGGPARCQIARQPDNN